MTTTPVLKSLSASITLETDGPVVFLNVQAASELDKIRELQTEINAVITEKISSLKADNKLPEVLEDEDECDPDDGE